MSPLKRSEQRGVALILALIMMLVMSVTAVSLTFVARTETWSSMNYRLMSQARSAAEAGINKAANHLMNSYNKPSGGAMSDYTVTASPVTYNGNPVVLSATSRRPSNYPVSADQSSFSSAAQGDLTIGNTTARYAASAKLIAMRQLKPYGSSSFATIQTWEITSDGTIAGVQNAQVQVTATLEQQAWPVFQYAAFATSPGCSALQFGGGGSTGSYDSSNQVAGTQDSGGNVGTNGNLTTGGSTTTIYGSLSTPRSGVGTCTTNNVTAWQQNNGTVTGGIIELPQAVNYPLPDAPSPMPPTTNHTLNNNNCLNDPVGCTGNNGVYSLAPGGCPPNGTPATYGNITLHGDLHLSAGCYNINSIVENGQGKIIVDSGPVIINIAGQGFSAGQDVLKLNGGGISNPSLIPTNLQFLYRGTGNVKFNGGALAAALLYAPAASLAFSGGGNWYGAVISQTLTDLGGARIVYDRRLQHEAETLGNYTLGSFSWKKY